MLFFLIFFFTKDHIYLGICCPSCIDYNQKDYNYNIVSYRAIHRTDFSFYKLLCSMQVRGQMRSVTELGATVK